MAKTDPSDLDIQYLKGVGPRRAALLKRLNIRTVRDAMYYLPYRYEDRRALRKMRDLVPGAFQTAVGRVVSMDEIRPRRGRLRIFELTITDGSGAVTGKWFNQPYMKKRFSAGTEVMLSGVVKPAWRGGGGWEMDNPEFEFVSDDGDSPIHASRIVPVYRATEGLGSRQLRGIIASAMNAHLGDMNDPVPSEILKRHGLPGLRESITACHFPEDGIESLEQWRSPFQKRLSFDDFFMLELGLAAIKKQRGRERGIGFKPTGKLVNRLLASLPFRLTGAQEKALEDILSDMRSPYPMNRLLQGDVGSGKTLVALVAMLSAVECGYQAALMAPTELLAEQHYANMLSQLKGLGPRLALVTGGRRERKLEEIKAGDVDIVVGTHALIEEGVRFGRLGLVVVDEQHRFGVAQRARMRRKARNPDVLIMTATPIPRTLSMTLYGDLDYSVMKELPAGRTAVHTEVCRSEDKARVYEAIGSEVKAGGQVYVVYPVIEGSEKTDLKSAVTGAEALAKIFPSMRVALIHGRMKPAERDSTMGAFKSGDVDVLVSTTVIEVGVDVPNASLMVIVHAERFGLSQLHQLRGRVGRGRRASRCVLLAYPPLGEEARRRLDAMAGSTDGFRIAEEDLLIRGPGEVMGTKQSGMPDLRVADIVRDAEVLSAARKEAFGLIEEDPELAGLPALRSSLERFWSGKIELFKTG